MKRILLLSTLALVALAGLGLTHAQPAVEAWVRSYNGPADSVDVATRVVVDSSGNVVVAGYSDARTNAYDFLILKYSGAGVPLWTNRFNGPANGDDTFSAVAVDGSGNVFVTGYSASTNVSPHNYDYATIKYSGSGMPLWTNRYSGPANGDDYPTALAVDGSGNVIVAGNSGGVHATTIKYSSAGTALWTNRYDGAAAAVAVDGSGNAFVTGTSGGGGYSDYRTIKYSAAGTPLWTNGYAGPEPGSYRINHSTALAVDGSGNVFVTGASLVSEYYDSTDDYSVYDYDYATIKYSAAGVPLWTNLYAGPGNEDTPRAAAVDGDGNVFVTGFSLTSVHQYGVDNIYSSAYATIKYSAEGVLLWGRSYRAGPPDAYDYASALAVDGSGNVFVTRNSIGISEDFATIKYSGAGVPLWTNRFNGTSNGSDWAEAVAVDGSGNVFVTGASTDGTNCNYATIKYSSAVPPQLTIARTTTNTVAISWPSPSTGFTLQQNTNNIATPNWSNVLTTPTDNGTTKTVIVNPASGNRFYRLKNP